MTIHANSSREFDMLVAGFNDMTHKLREHKALEERGIVRNTWQL